MNVISVNGVNRFYANVRELMVNSSLCGSLLLTLLVFASCNMEEGKVRQLASDFASKVIDNDVRGVRSMYAGAECYDAFAVDYAEEKMVVEEQDGRYTVKYNDEQSVIICKGDDGQLKIAATYGIFVFDLYLFDFAVRTGWIDKYMDDATIAGLLSDYEFKEFMMARIMKELRSKVTASAGGGGASFHAISAYVNNGTDYDIPGDAYKVLYRTIYWAFPEDNQTITLDGVDLPAHGRATLKGTKRGTGEATETSVQVKFDEDLLPSLCLHVYKANGHEYNDWKKGGLR